MNICPGFYILDTFFWSNQFSSVFICSGGKDFSGIWTLFFISVKSKATDGRRAACSSLSCFCLQDIFLIYAAPPAGQRLSGFLPLQAGAAAAVRRAARTRRRRWEIVLRLNDRKMSMDKNVRKWVCRQSDFTRRGLACFQRSQWRLH